jgi:rhomboid protease GluP
LLPLKEDIFEFWIPIGLPIIPILIWYRKTTSRYSFKKGGDAPNLLNFILWASLGVTLFITNKVLITASGELTAITNIKHVNQIDTKYISIDTIEVNRSFGTMHPDFRISGKSNQNFNIDLFFVYPFAK